MPCVVQSEKTRSCHRPQLEGLDYQLKLQIVLLLVLEFSVLVFELDVGGDPWIDDRFHLLAVCVRFSVVAWKDLKTTKHLCLVCTVQANLVNFNQLFRLALKIHCCLLLAAVTSVKSDCHLIPLYWSSSAKIMSQSGISYSCMLPMNMWNPMAQFL